MNIKSLAQLAAPVLGGLNGALYSFTSANTPNYPFLVSFQGTKRIFNSAYQIKFLWPVVRWNNGLHIYPRFKVTYLSNADSVTVVYYPHRTEFRLQD